MDNKPATVGLDTFWETCDRDAVEENPLERELSFRLDALKRYQSQIEVAEAIGDDEAVNVLSRYYDETATLTRRIREAILNQTPPRSTA